MFRFILIVALAGIAISLGACASSTPEPEAPVEAAPLQQDLTRRMLNPLLGDPGRLKRAGVPNVRDLRVNTAVVPAEFGLSVTKRLQVVFSIRNEGKKAVNLVFNNAQRIEILVKRPDGTVASKWSDDQMFGQETGFLLINPNEAISYAETIATREMRAGLTYTISAYFVGYPDLGAETRVIPAP